MKSFLTNILLVLLCLQAAFADTKNQTNGQENSEKIREEKIQLSQFDPNNTGTVPISILEGLKAKANAMLTELKALEKNGNITIKQPEDCTTMEEKMFHSVLSQMDEDNNGIISLSDRNHLEEDAETVLKKLNDYIEKATKGVKFSVKDFAADMKEADRKMEEKRAAEKKAAEKKAAEKKEAEKTEAEKTENIKN